MQQSEVVCNLSAGTELVTAWLQWFLDCLGRAIHGTGTSLGGILDKARFWENFAAFTLNERQKYPETVARRVRWQTHDLEAGRDHEVFAGHSDPGYQRPGRKKNSHPKRGRRPQDELCAGSAMKVLRAAGVKLRI